MSSAPHVLSLDERRRLRNIQIKKHNLANILLHWFNVACWLFMLPTGLAILISPHFRVTTPHLNSMLRSMFGGLFNLIYFHQTLGLIWIFVLLFNIILGFRKYFIPFGERNMAMDRDDWEWFKMKPLQVLGFKAELPPQGAYNAGQKAYSYVVFLGIFTIMITGLILTFPAYMPARWIVQWALPFHFLAVGGVVAGLVVHVYMGAVFPEEKSAFFSMFTGNVNGLYAYSHHYKFFRQKAAEMEEWERAERRKIAEEMLRRREAEEGSEAIKETGS